MLKNTQAPTNDGQLILSGFIFKATLAIGRVIHDQASWLIPFPEFYDFGELDVAAVVNASAPYPCLRR